MRSTYWSLSSSRSSSKTWPMSTKSRFARSRSCAVSRTNRGFPSVMKGRIALKRLEELEQRSFVGGGQGDVGVFRFLALAPMPEDRFRDRTRTPVMQIIVMGSTHRLLERTHHTARDARGKTETPQRCRTPLRAGRFSLTE